MCATYIITISYKNVQNYNFYPDPECIPMPSLFKIPLSYHNLMCHFLFGKGTLDLDSSGFKCNSKLVYQVGYFLYLFFNSSN